MNGQTCLHPGDLAAAFTVVEVFLGLRGDAAEGRALSECLQRKPLSAQWRDTLQAGTAVLELGAGRYEAALYGAFDARSLWPLLSPQDAIEAAMRCGQTEIARFALAEFTPAAEAAGSPWALGILACCQALLAADAAEAEDNHRRSVELLCTTPHHLGRGPIPPGLRRVAASPALAAAVPTRAAVAGSLG
jgi:hypothetical protein